MNGLPVRVGARALAFLGVFLFYPLARGLALGMGPLFREGWWDLDAVATGLGLLLAVSVALGHSGA
jgi:hypothetical protein